MTLDDLLAAVAALPTLRASEIDGEESDGTPRHYRDRPYVSRTKLERLLREHWSHGVAAAPAPSIPATWQHDAGAYAQCYFCLRYTRNPKALSHRSFLCDCGSAEGWSGSFKPPGADARWLDADGVIASDGGKQK